MNQNSNSNALILKHQLLQWRFHSFIIQICYDTNSLKTIQGV